MSRTDRLLDLLGSLRDGRLHRAEDLARRFGVSQRTIYRDLDTLVASGVPVAGERGLGYRATAALTLPPLNLSEPEVEALRLALLVLQSDVPAGDGALAEAARSVGAKLAAALPDASGRSPAAPALALGAFGAAARGFRHIATARAALRARQKLKVEPGGQVLRPLRLDYWGRAWTLAGWSETAGAFVTLRLDAIEEVIPLPHLFGDEAGRRLADLDAATAEGRASAAEES